MIGWALGLTCETAWVLRYSLLVHSVTDHLKMAYFQTGFSRFWGFGGWVQFYPPPTAGVQGDGFPSGGNRLGSGTLLPHWSQKPLKIAENGV